MTPTTSPRMLVVKKEVKEIRLRALLETALETVGPNAELCLLIQGSESPAARALASVAADLAARGTTFKILMSKFERPSVLPDGIAATYRVLTDTRCHDAHELLVLGTTSAWIGDSMRRNPSATDSFELHALDSAKTAAMVAVSFARLWSIATPTQVAPSPERRAAMDLAGELAALAVDGKTSITASTRH